MTIPTHQSLLKPLLKLISDENVWTLKKAVARLSIELKLSNSDFIEMQPSGRQSKFEKRVGWARFYLGKAGLIKSVRHGEFVITNLGLKALKRKSSIATMPKIRQWLSSKK